jgi:hypothetical protein
MVIFTVLPDKGSAPVGKKALKILSYGPPVYSRAEF